VSLYVIKKPRTRGGYSPARGLQNTNSQWVVAQVGKKNLSYNKPSSETYVTVLRTKYTWYKFVNYKYWPRCTDIYRG